MEKKEDGRWALKDYELVSMDDTVAKDEEIQKSLDEFNDGIDEDYLEQFGFSAEQVLAENDVEFEDSSELDRVHTEHALGDIMSDAYRYTVDGLNNGEPPVDVAVVPSGVVRGTYLKGAITVANVFDSFSLGSGPDQIAGYPLISVYLTGKELRTAAEVDASISDIMTTARLYMSGMSFSYNPHRMILNKVTDVWMTPGLMDDARAELEDDRLYRVVADLYSGRMLGAVADKSFGILSLVPKFADGTKVEKFEDAIIYDKEGNEVKAWAAIASYMESFEKNENGTSQVPDYYETDHDRKVVEESKSIGALLKNPSKYAWMIYGVVTAAAAIVTLIIILIVKLVKRLRRKSGKKSRKR